VFPRQRKRTKADKRREKVKADNRPHKQETKETPSMNATTKTILNATLAGDASVSPAERAAVFKILEGKTAAAYTNPAPLDRALTRDQVAEILHCSTKSVSRYAKRGIIRAICLGAKAERASCGYSEASVRAALRRMSGEMIGATQPVEVEIVEN
jgi:hypothetical protein